MYLRVLQSELSEKDKPVKINQNWLFVTVYRRQKYVILNYINRQTTRINNKNNIHVRDIILKTKNKTFL